MALQLRRATIDYQYEEDSPRNLPLPVQVTVTQVDGAEYVFHMHVPWGNRFDISLGVTITPNPTSTPFTKPVTPIR